MLTPSPDLVAGLERSRAADAVFVNAPLRDYGQRPRVNDFTLPVLGLAYIATYAAERGFNVAGVYIEEGVSGRHDRRPSFQRLLSEIPTPEIPKFAK